jgi:pantoate--beta-alanine ligase
MALSTRMITTVAEMRAFSHEVRSAGKSLALVPTMGALHEGHLSLIRRATRQCDAVVVSIFVNPTQFGPGEDFSLYPRNLEKDLEALTALRVAAAFAPPDKEMYPDTFETFVEPGEIGASFEGACRPGHFRGVATVVLKLLNIVRPEVAYFGQKDFQQVQVIRRLTNDLDLDVRLAICPIVRESDGLAKSSRNTHLSAQDRTAALALYRCLQRAEELVDRGEATASALLEEMRKVVAAEPRVGLDYLAIVEPAGLRSVDRIFPGTVALIAARVGPVRLIDNLIFGPPGSSPELRLELALRAQPVLGASARLPGLEADSLKARIESCRDCAALAYILLPPREFLGKYLKRDYPDLNSVRVLVIGTHSPINAEHFLYRSPDAASRFTSGLYELLGVKDFQDFRARFALTDAIRCHSAAPRVPEKGLEHCTRHLREELKLFPNLESIVLLGEDAYRQFQNFVLGRDPDAIVAFETWLGERGWADETARVPGLGEQLIRVFYCYHPTWGYKRSPSLAGMLG